MPTTQDRITELRSRPSEFTGIEFVQVVDVCEQTRLRVYFITDPGLLQPSIEDDGDPQGEASPISFRDIRIYSPRGEAADVEVIPCPAATGETMPPATGLRWDDDPAVGRRYVEVCVAEPGTFTDYRLRIDDPRIDRAFNDVPFSFKVGCDSLLDCAQPAKLCPPDPSADFPVDYLARDFVSIRNALLDFAAQRYPGWQRPIEADVGVMLMEVMAALGDEFSYIQDRMNREAYLETATERRSLRRKARLVDHEIHDGRMAATVIELVVAPGMVSVPIGAPVWARTPGDVLVAFELGDGMRDPNTDVVVDAAWNPGGLAPYCFDDDHACLDIGATELFVENLGAFDEGEAALWSAGRPLLLRAVPEDAADPERLHLVRVSEMELTRDELLNRDLARIRWDERDALTFPIVLDSLQLSGNVVGATAGARRTAFFRLGPLQPGDIDNGVIRAVERAGPLYSAVDAAAARRANPCDDTELSGADRPPVYLLSLPETDEFGLAFADPADDLRRAVPEIQVYPVADVADEPIDPWTFRRSLLFDGSDDEVFTLEDGTWRRILGHVRNGQDIAHRDYASGAGYTVRLGDGEFGLLPVEGALFRVDYRIGFGTRANVAAGSVRLLAADGLVSPLQGIVERASNPFAVASGVDPESAAQIRLLTPEAYRAGTFFAVKPEDYGRQAETLGFVQRAQGSFHWTGSWLSAVTAVDPKNAFSLAPEQRAEVEARLDLRRQAGREVIVRNPKYVNLDLIVTVCIAASSYPGQVKMRVLEALFGGGGPPPVIGFFSPDNFTFGTALRRSSLEASILAVGGVTAVLEVQLRVLGETDFSPFTDLIFDVPDDCIIRVANDPLRPERGSVTLQFEGGA